jgi:hypothetical protein
MLATAKEQENCGSCQATLQIGTEKYQLAYTSLL